jgi:glycine betaine catabolism B
MYRLLMYGLGILAGIAIVFAFADLLQLSGFGLLVSLATLITVCWFVNLGLAKFYNVNTNTESAVISALILFFIMPPAADVRDFIILALAGSVAMASKYVLAIKGRHIFNPAATGAVVVGLIGLKYASWWVASSVLAVPVLLFCLVVLRKIHRGWMFLAYIVPAFLLLFWKDGRDLITFTQVAFASYPLIFLGAIMLTEPVTTPPTRRWQIVYGVIVGVLIGLAPSLGPIYVTPEIALLIGNAFAFAVGPKQRPVIKLREVREIAPGILEFIFYPVRKFTFQAGQYLELTLSMQKTDQRGNRRTFTIASSPTEEEVRLDVKFYNPSSTFKSQFKNLKPGTELGLTQVAGDFTLPGDKNKKLAFIAGGIGVTPYLSIIKYLGDTDQRRDISLLYSVSNPEQFVHKDLLDRNGRNGVRSAFIDGAIDAETIKNKVPDFKERIFYVSGPVAMVNDVKRMLYGMGVKPYHIKSDYFAGY